MSETVIRHFEQDDLPQIRAIYLEQEAFGNTLQLPYQSLAHWARRMGRKGSTHLVATRGGELLGHLSIDVLQGVRRRHVATIGMGVKASCRGSGVGSALMRAAIDLCERWMNISRIELEVFTDNRAGIALYCKHGFTVEGTCKRYAYRDGAYVDVHIMSRLKASE